MANSVSFVIRAIDLTKQAVNSAKAQLGGLMNAFGGSQIGGMLGKGLFVGALALSAKRVAAWAEEIKSASAGAFGEFETRGANSISRVTGYLRALGQEFKNTIVGGLGKTLEVLGLSSGESGTGIDAAQLEKDTAQRDRINLLMAEAKGEDAVLRLKEDQLSAVLEKQAKDEHNNDLLEERLKLEKEIAGLKEKQAADAAKIRASEAKMREEQSARLAEMRGQYAQAALDPAKRREMAKEVREKERSDRKLASLANAAEYGMANGIAFSKLGKNKQLAWLARQSDSFDPSKALVSIQEATKNIANALGVGASK